MCRVAVIPYVRRLALRLVREPRGRGVGGSEVTMYIAHAGGGRLWARGLTGPCLSCLFSLLRSRCAFQAVLFCSFSNSYSAVCPLLLSEGRVPTSQDRVLLLVNDSSVTHLNLELCLVKETYAFLYSTLFLCFSTLLTCRQRGQCLFFLKKA